MGEGNADFTPVGFLVVTISYYIRGKIRSFGLSHGLPLLAGLPYDDQIMLNNDLPIRVVATPAMRRMEDVLGDNTK